MNKKKDPETVTPTDKPASFKEATADFAVNLAKTSMSDSLSKNENALVSPLSVMSAMSLVLNGADSDTKTELMNVMCGSQSVDEFNAALSEYQKELTGSSSVKFHLADSIWFKDSDDITVNADYLANMQNIYQAEVYKEAFDEKTLTKLNKWVDTNTDHMIPKLLDEFDTDTRMVLANALAFDGNWMKPYKDSQIAEKQKFKNSDGTTSKVTMLNSSEYLYLEDEQATGFMKYYEGGDYAFVAILPKNDVTTEAYLSQLDGTQFTSLLQGVQTEYKVETKTPVFSYDYDADLVDSFKALGVSNLFDEDLADLSQMVQTTDPDKNIYVTQVIHKTHIEVNAAGTKAAAATGIVADVTSARPNEKIKEVSLDRPFVYAIVDTTTDLPVFIGAVNKL